MAGMQGRLIKIYASLDDELLPLVADLQRKGLDVEIQRGAAAATQGVVRISGWPESELMSLAESLKRGGLNVEMSFSSP